MFGRRKGKRSLFGSPEEPTPEEEAAVEAGLERLAEEKRKALADPGPDWKTWFYHDNARLWIGLAFLTVDSWIVAFWFEPFDPIGLVLSLAGAIYLEYLGYLYLFRRPAEGPSRSGRYRRRWWQPFEYGRWTPEGERARAGHPAVPEGAPDPDEFL